MITEYFVLPYLIVNETNLGGRLGIGIMVRDHEGYVHAVMSITRLGHLEPVAA